MGLLPIPFNKFGYQTSLYVIYPIKKSKAYIADPDYLNEFKLTVYSFKK